jgi:hypothetical protein
MNKIEVGDKVKETTGYRRWARDRAVRGEVYTIKGDLITVRNKEGWSLDLHRDWLEIDYNHPQFSPNIWGATHTKELHLAPGVFKKTPKFCQHCGEKL